jgi:hypothetical protein
MTSANPYRIGGGTSFLVDSAMGVPQLLGAGVDAIICDYLAEGAMGLLGRARLADPAKGYAPYFLTTHVGPHLEKIAASGTKIVANAGGVNPAALAAEVRAEVAQRGLALKVACISGDDLLPRLGAFTGTPDMENGRALPAEGVHSLNAYLGAFPVAEAIRRGADIVITGRVVDSALTLGLLIARFGWGRQDWDLLAAGTLAGHLIECNGQVTGGTFTDWDQVTGWANMGSPIAECWADGRVVITKPERTGGLVSPATVAEQMLYETSDPQAYIVPDVVLDMTQVKMRAVGADRVEVTGAVGHLATDSLKVCATWDAGWRGIAYQPIIGPRAVERAQVQAEAIFERCATLLRGGNKPAFLATEAILIGAGTSLGERGFNADAQELVLKLVADHPTAEGAGLMVFEQSWAMSSGVPGNSIAFGQGVTPLMHLASFLVAKGEVTALLDMGDGAEALADAHLPGGFDVAKLDPEQNAAFQHRHPELVSGSTSVPNSQVIGVTEKWMLKQVQHDGSADFRFDTLMPVPPKPNLSQATETRTLGELAWLRSGEKGETINIGVISREPAMLPWIRSGVEAALKDGWLDHLFGGAPARFRIYDVPGIAAFNVVLEGALPGGINNSTRLDPAAKSVAQQMVGSRVVVPLMG